MAEEGMNAAAAAARTRRSSNWSSAARAMMIGWLNRGVGRSIDCVVWVWVWVVGWS